MRPFNLQGLENGVDTINFSSKKKFIFGIYVMVDDSFTVNDDEYTFASVSIYGLKKQKLTFNMSRSNNNLLFLEFRYKCGHN